MIMIIYCYYLEVFIMKTINFEPNDISIPVRFFSLETDEKMLSIFKKINNERCNKKTKTKNGFAETILFNYLKQRPLFTGIKTINLYKQSRFAFYNGIYYESWYYLKNDLNTIFYHVFNVLNDNEKERFLLLLRVFSIEINKKFSNRFFGDTYKNLVNQQYYTTKVKNSEQIKFAFAFKELLKPEIFKLVKEYELELELNDISYDMKDICDFILEKSIFNLLLEEVNKPHNGDCVGHSSPCLKCIAESEFNLLPQNNSNSAIWKDKKIGSFLYGKYIEENT